ncbi:MAG TPA: ABC transporter ATP-binding protein [Bacteroidales bacterium]|nr:ABC transporter ATP-binding protein [Bacteroidales bacterium]
MNPLLEVKNLCISFNNSGKAVDNLSFSLPVGQTLGIVGESGSGKSVTGLAITRLLPKTTNISGQILAPHNWLDNAADDYIDLLQLPEKSMIKLRGKRISFIFQEPMTALNPSMHCGKQIEEILKLHKIVEKSNLIERQLQLLKDVQLPNPEIVLKKYPHQLSGGQRQRLMIAMAMAANPDIIIADEPTTALDVTVQFEILELLKQMKQERNLTMIFISHDLNVISHIADNVLVMRHGNMMEQGTVRQVMNNPQHLYTKALLESKPSFHSRPVKLPTVDDFIDEKPFYKEEESIELRKEKQNKIYNARPLIEISNLNVGFSLKSLFNKQQTLILRGIDLKIWKGETLGLVGGSGSGKTTLGRTLMQLIEGYQGNIKYEGKKIKDFSKNEMLKFRQKVQLVFQDPYSSLNPYQTIGQSITEPIIVHNLYKNNSEVRNRAIELMQMTRIQPEWYSRYPHQLSGGQRQRVVIARALALNPEVLICDESVSALDVSVQAQVLNLLNELKEKIGLTYIFISHDLAVVKYMSDRIVVLDKGLIVEDNEADELCQNPAHPYTQRLLSAAKME